jgi:hypothetical protein
MDLTLKLDNFMGVELMEDKWITSKGKHILLGEGGTIKGGAVPKSAQGQKLDKWAERISVPRNIQRREGESEEDYQKRARKERAAMRKAEKAIKPPPEHLSGKSEVSTKLKPEGLKKLNEQLTTVGSNIINKRIDSLIENLNPDTIKNDPSGHREAVNQIHRFLTSQGVKFGGELKLEISAPEGKKKGLDRVLKAATKSLPSHWVEAINNSGYRITLAESDREYIRSRDRIIAITPSSLQSSVAHELAHVVELKLGLAQKNKDYIESRKKPGEEAKWLGPPYERNEEAIHDSFSNPYIGKIYNSNSTEVLSMGMNILYTRSYMVKCLKEDPGYLKYILKQMIPPKGGK